MADLTEYDDKPDFTRYWEGEELTGNEDIPGPRISFRRVGKIRGGIYGIAGPLEVIAACMALPHVEAQMEKPHNALNEERFKVLKARRETLLGIILGEDSE